MAVCGVLRSPSTTHAAWVAPTSGLGFLISPTSRAADDTIGSCASEAGAGSHPPCMRSAAVLVASIDDYELAMADDRMSSAVDQLETLSLYGHGMPNVADLIGQFGKIDLMHNPEPRTFDFRLPSACAVWPGPHFGHISLHNVLAQPPTMASKQRGRPQAPRPRSRPHNSARAKPSPKTTCAARRIPPSLASRTPPLHLLTLPPEIRNAVWTLVVVHRGPIEAYLRHVWPSTKTKKKPRRRLVRRFPLEPPVAAVSKQLRQEVLSIFYASNHFVLEKKACNSYNGLTLMNPLHLQQWRPRPELAKFLRRVDIRYHVVLGWRGASTVVYKLRCLASRQVTVAVTVVERGGAKNQTEPVDACLCGESAVVGAVQEAMGHGADLADLSSAVVEKRLERQFGNRLTESKIFPRSEATCAKCTKRTFGTVYSGL